MVRPLDEEISRQIREEAAELLTEMETALLELEDSPDDTGLVNRVFRAMHTIKGAANMFGMDKVAYLTHEVETAFDQVRNGRLAVSRPLLDVAFQAKDLTWPLIVEPDESDDKKIKDIVQDLQDIIAGKYSSPAAAPEEAPQPPLAEEGDALADEPHEPEAIETERVPPLQPAEETPPDPEQEPPGPNPEQEPPGPKVFAILFRPTSKGLLVHADPLGILDELGELGECTVLARPDDVPDLTDLETESCALWWEMLLRTEASEDAVRDVFIFVEDMSELEITEVADPDAWLASRVDLLSLARVEPPAPLEPVQEPAQEPAPEPVAQPLPEQESSALASPAAVSEPLEEKPPAGPPPAAKEKTSLGCIKREVSTSIRVDAYKLDDMVALVGELVIAQARLTQISSNSHDALLQNVTEEIELLSNSLRDRTLSMRMLPIGTTFDRFRRLVRDLSHELGKEIELITQGAETELDKTVIEQLGDPLVHLLRNSIDHGLETPQQREAAGKSPKGTIVLSAEHSGGHVLIRIFDDGRGLDRERIAAKAVERGLVNAPDALSDREVFSLVFQPGFSTAESISNVSGRGVGMDVVKRSIEALRGKVEIDSSQGAGTTVTVKLPLTLAIIEGLQVRVGEDFFVIPLSTVQECVELTDEERGRDRENTGKRIINLREVIVPYIRLREWFSIDGDEPEIEQIIIAGDENAVTGIVVDEVVGQQQTVIKSLGRIFKDVDEFSGATIKGDGTMALILDVPQLVRKVLADTHAHAHVE